MTKVNAIEPAVLPSLLARMDALRQRAAATGEDGYRPACDRCDDTKWVTVDGFAMRCPACATTSPGAPSTPFEFRAAMLGNYEQLPGNAAAVKAARLWPASTRDLFLHGGVGSGKTRLACSMLNEFYALHRGGLFIQVSGMLFSMQPRDDGTPERLWERLIDSPVLVLDDLGAEREDATDYSRRMVLQLYEARWARGYRTIWTSNKSLDELSIQLQDERLVSRLGGRADIVKLTTGDRRIAGRR